MGYAPSNSPRTGASKAPPVLPLPRSSISGEDINAEEQLKMLTTRGEQWDRWRTEAQAKTVGARSREAIRPSWLGFHHRFVRFRSCGLSTNPRLGW